MNKMSDKNDLTTGSVWKKLVIFFLPIAAGTILQQLYNAVDGLIVGRFVGTEALAAVGGSAAPRGPPSLSGRSSAPGAGRIWGGPSAAPLRS